MKYSGKQIIRAGEKLADNRTLSNSQEFSDAMDVVSYWRLCHEKSLDNALALLRASTLKYDKKAVFAKRLKRYVSIVNKLKRFKEMKLKNMQDIGGCRAIVANPKKLLQVVRELRKRPEFKNETGVIRAKDYLSNPKEDGYRGYHLIGQFCDANGGKRSIELQVRTALQHDWATALEIVDLFTGQALKSNQGEHDWKLFFSSVSKQLAIMESVHMFNIKTNKLELYKEALYKSDDGFSSCKLAKEYCSKLKVINNLQAFANSLKIADGHLEEIGGNGYVLIEVNTMERKVTTTVFDEKDNKQAEEMYTKAEKIAALSEYLVVALVSSTAIGGIKEAYPNYFADSTDFVQYLYLIDHVELPQPKKVIRTLSDLMSWRDA